MMTRTLFYFVVLTAFVSCGKDDFNSRQSKADNISNQQQKKSDDAKILPPKPREGNEFDKKETVHDVAFAAMNKYCRSCHGVGRLRFFHSDNPRDFFADLNKMTSPISNTKWLPLIVDAISWPTDEAPSFETTRYPSGKDWMPLGSKRLSLSDDFIGDVKARHFLVQYLEQLQ